MSRQQQIFENAPTAATENNFEYSRGNVEFTVAPSAARSAGATFTGFTNHNARSLFLFVDITVNASSLVITPEILWLDPVTESQTETIQTGNGFTVVGGGIGIFTLVPRSFQVKITHDIAGTITYSLGGCLVV